MLALPCIAPATLNLTRRPFRATASLRSTSQLSPLPPPHPLPFVPEVVEAVDALYSEFRAVDSLVACNTARVLKSFQNARVGSHHFAGCTGYGHDEPGGREALDQAFAEIFGAESAIVRSQFFSGTHAITCALFALLRPGDELLAVAGAPYDTLEEVIGIRDSIGLGSLKDFGVKYREVPLGKDGGLDWHALISALKPQTRCAFIQRSCGYSWRHSLSVHEIGKAIEMIKMQNPNCLVMVDNCYGEFVETMEPPMVGADLIAGSLIKNPGGTIAPCGGYVAGKEKWVKAAAARLSAPGLGIDCGSTPGDIMRAFFQGLFLSPQMVGEAVKGGLLIAEVMASKGYTVQPLPRVLRYDTVQAVQLGSCERLIAFCEAVQRCSPVGSFTKPVAGSTPGYASELLAVLLPILGLGAFLWWAGRDIIQSSCPNCGNNFQIFKSSLNDELQLCPFCSQPFSVVGNKFVKDSTNFSNQSSTFGQMFNDFSPHTKKGKDSSAAVVDVEADIKDAD